MTTSLRIPQGILNYSAFHQIDPRDVAQFSLDEVSREFTEMLCEGEGPGEEVEPVSELSAARN